MISIETVDAWEILDSRGRPTVAATVVLEGGAAATISVPSGASTGRAEAKELRDGGKRFRGLGCQQAVANIRGPIAAALKNGSFESQEQLDTQLLELDGTADKSRLGANAILAVSLAFARAAAAQGHLELFEYFNSLLPSTAPRLPALSINLFSGGKHAFGQVAIQDVLVIPRSGSSTSDRLAQMYDIYQEAAVIIRKRYAVPALTADEGGLAPPFANSSEMLETAIEAIQGAGYELGTQVALAVDVAASHFITDGGLYQLDNRTLSPDELIEIIDTWSRRYQLVSVEDGLPARIQRAVESSAANALLLKVNQIGTLTEAKKAYLLARQAGWRISISARSGETEDNWLADLAVGWAGDFIKVGSITQSERLAKYNRLLQIEYDHFRGHS